MSLLELKAILLDIYSELIGGNFEISFRLWNIFAILFFYLHETTQLEHINMYFQTCGNREKSCH